MHAQLLESQIQNTQQWISETEGPEKQILASTAETFRIAALIHLRCRIYGYVCNLLRNLFPFPFPFPSPFFSLTLNPDFVKSHGYSTRFTRFDPFIIALADKLYAALRSLPVHGPLYTAIYPIWPFFVAAVTTTEDKRERLCRREGLAREGNRDRLTAVLRRIAGIRTWLADQDPNCTRQDGWWELMLTPAASTMPLGTNLLCLG
ncbi:hypothetical protein ACJQWK_09388 [Exserohilum turcicum]